MPLRSKGRSGMATAGHFVFRLSDVDPQSFGEHYRQTREGGPPLHRALQEVLPLSAPQTWLVKAATRPASGLNTHVHCNFGHRIHDKQCTILIEKHRRGQGVTGDRNAGIVTEHERYGPTHLPCPYTYCLSSFDSDCIA